LRILLIYGGGIQREALLLAASAQRIRVMMSGMADALEFCRMVGAWAGESGATVEIGAAGCLEAAYDRWFEEPAPRPLAITV